jgi:hypothetical protein
MTVVTFLPEFHRYIYTIKASIAGMSRRVVSGPNIAVF